MEFIIPKFIEGSTCFERHTAHYQELQIVFAASGLYAHVVTGRCPGWTTLSRLDNVVQPGQRLVSTCVYKPEAGNTVWSSWWWEVCRSKHVESSINFGIINSITRLHLVGYFCWFILRFMKTWILNLKVYGFSVSLKRPTYFSPSTTLYRGIRILMKLF